MVGTDHATAIATVALFGVAVVLLLVFSGLALLLARRSRRRRWLKLLVAAVAGGICGTLWVLSTATILDAARPIGDTELLSIVAGGGVVALIATVLLSGPGRLREVVGRALLTTGFHSLALPIVALTAFLVGGAQFTPDGGARTETGLSAVMLGVRMAGNVATVGLSVGGLLAGAFLVFLGDRLLRQARLVPGGGLPPRANGGI